MKENPHRLKKRRLSVYTYVALKTRLVLFPSVHVSGAMLMQQTPLRYAHVAVVLAGKKHNARFVFPALRVPGKNCTSCSDPHVLHAALYTTNTENSFAFFEYTFLPRK